MKQVISLLQLFGPLVAPELAKQVHYLKTENRILRSKLPKQVKLTPMERGTLISAGTSLGTALRDIIHIVTFRTFQRWLKLGDLVSGAERRGRPRTPEKVRELVLRLGQENAWGTTRIVGELKKLGIRISRTTIRSILRDHSVPPVPERRRGDWVKFVRRHINSLWACDFFTKQVWTLKGLTTYYVFFFMEVSTREVHIGGTTPNPDGRWMAQQARNICICLDETGQNEGILIRDRDKKFTMQFDRIVEGSGVKITQIAPRTPQMNGFAEAWVGSIKRECLNQFVVFGEDHLRYLLNEYVDYYNTVRPHRGLGNSPVGRMAKHALSRSPPGKICCQDRLDGLLRHYYRVAG